MIRFVLRHPCRDHNQFLSSWNSFGMCSGADEACMTQAQDTDLEREHHTDLITHFLSTTVVINKLEITFEKPSIPTTIRFLFVVPITDYN